MQDQNTSGATATDAPDTPRHDAPSHDIPRHDATRDYSLTLDEVAARFDAAGLPRSMRTLQRYCASGRLDGPKTDTIAGEQYFVDPHSVERTITELKQLSALTQRTATEPAKDSDAPRHVSTRRDMSPGDENINASQSAITEPRHVTTSNDMTGYDASLDKEFLPENSRHVPPNPVMARHDATENSFMSRYVERVEAENGFLREQVDRKDQQIEALLERDKETNFLVRGLQQMLTPLLGHDSQSRDQYSHFGGK